MARRRSVLPTPEELLAASPPNVREIVEKLRSIVKESAPDVAESVSPGWRLPGAPFPSWRMILFRVGRRPLGFVAWQGDEVRFGLDSGEPVGPGSRPYETFRGPDEIRAETLRPRVAVAVRVATTPRPRRESPGGGA